MARQGAGPLSSESLALSSFHLVQRGWPPGPQACLQGKPWGCRGKGLSVTLTPTVTGVRSPQPLGPLEMSTEMVRVLPEVRGGWGSTRAEPAGTRCLEGVGSGHRVGWLGGTHPDSLATAGTKADRSSTGLSRCWGLG